MSSSRCLAFFSRSLLAVGDLLLERFEVLFLAGEFLLLLLGGVLALLSPALQFANFGAGGFEFARQFLAAAEGFVAGFQFGIADDLFGVAARLLDQFVPASFAREDNR